MIYNLAVMNRRTRSLGAAALLLLASAARAGAVTEAELAREARKQPVLHLDTNGLAYATVLVEAFSKRHPFVKIVRSFTPPAGWNPEPHFAGEDAEKRLDVKLGCQKPDLADWADRGWLARFDDLPNWKGAPHHLENDPRWTYLLGAPAVLFYDPAKIPDAEAPRSYEELTGPRWTGKVAFRNPKMGTSGAFLAEFMRAARGGLDWYERLGRNKARMTDTGAEVLKLVADEGFIGVSRDVELLGNAKRFKTVMAADETPYQFQFGLISANAPHPAAARLFMNWALSAEARGLLESRGYSVGRRQREHLARPKVWMMDNRALRAAHAARLDEAVTLYHAGAASAAKAR